MPPRFGLLAALLIAAALSWRRPALRPITVALAALTAANFGHHYAKGALPRTDAAIWGMWPGISAAFAWRAWRGSWWPALPFLAYAVAVPLAPWSWAAHPWAWSVARVVPHWLAPLVALVAWSGRKEDGPEVAALRRLAPSPSTPPARPAFPSAALGSHADAAEPAEHAPSARPAQAIAAILAWSGFIDVTIGALSLSGTWDLAAPLSWATWALVARELWAAR